MIVGLSTLGLTGCVTRDGKVSLNPDDYSDAERLGYLGVLTGGAANALGAQGEIRGAIGAGMASNAIGLEAQRQAMTENSQSNQPRIIIVNRGPDYDIANDSDYKHISSHLDRQNDVYNEVYMNKSTGQVISVTSKRPDYVRKILNEK